MSYFSYLQPVLDLHCQRWIYHIKERNYSYFLFHSLLPVFKLPIFKRESVKKP